MAYEQPHGFIFTGNAAQGGTFVGPNYGNAAVFGGPPLPQLSFGEMNPTAQAQRFFQPAPPPTIPMPQRPPSGPPLPQTQPPPVGSPMRPGQYTAPPPPQPTLGPGGRTYQQIAGTPYLSAEEKAWFEAWYASQVPARQQTQREAGGQASVRSAQLPPPAPSDLRTYATQAAQSRGINPTYFQGLIGHESGWRPDAVNPKSGAAGLGQFLPSTAAAYGATPEALQSNPQLALDLSATMLGELTQLFHGDQLKALAAYFIGPGNVQEAVYQGGGRGWLQAADAIAQRYGQGSVSEYLQAIGAL